MQIQHSTWAYISESLNQTIACGSALRGSVQRTTLGTPQIFRFPRCVSRRATVQLFSHTLTIHSKFITGRSRSV